jgi:hypothetical protein
VTDQLRGLNVGLGLLWLLLIWLGWMAIDDQSGAGRDYLRLYLGPVAWRYTGNSRSFTELAPDRFKDFWR